MPSGCSGDRGDKRTPESCWSGLPQAAHGGQAGADQIAYRLMGRVGYPDGRQRACPMQLRQIDRISPVGLDPIPGLRGVWAGETPHSDVASP